MTTISVPDMMCENCVKRITNALTAAELKFSVSLDTKTFAQLDRVVFLQSGRHNTVTPTKT